MNFHILQPVFLFRHAEAAVWRGRLNGRGELLPEDVAPAAVRPLTCGFVAAKVVVALHWRHGRNA